MVITPERSETLLASSAIGLHLSNVRIPIDWMERCTRLARELVASQLFNQSLGQLYDGQETWSTLFQLGDLFARPPFERPPTSVQYAALEDVACWILDSSAQQFRLDDFWAHELELLFLRTTNMRERIIGLIFCLFKPLIRWYTAGYYKHLQAIEKSPPLFCQKYRAEPGTALQEASIQDWMEERIWGGQLLLRGGKLVVAPIRRCAFAVDRERLLSLSDGIQTLPFEPIYAPPQRPYPRLEDDKELYDYIQRQKDQDGA